jgi:hypothetical protein
MASRPGSLKRERAADLPRRLRQCRRQWILARVREIPAIVTQGATVDEAREMGRSALRD